MHRKLLETCFPHSLETGIYEPVCKMRVEGHIDRGAFVKRLFFIETLMGNIVSKQPSLCEILLSLEEKIVEKEIQLEVSRFRRSKLNFWFNVLIFTSPVFMAFLILTAGKHVIIYSVVFVVVLMLLKKALNFSYSVKIRKCEKLLSVYKDTQRLRVEELKKKSFYTETKEIIERYESTKDKKAEKAKISTKKRKGLIDQVADVVLGEDPSSMYALICSKCFFHNGLVKPSEYQHARFRCYNCNHHNKKDVQEEVYESESNTNAP